MIDDLYPFEAEDAETVTQSMRPDVMAATIAIRRSVPLSVRRGLARHDPIVVVLIVPTAAWCVPILNAAGEVLGDGPQIEFDAHRHNRLSSPRVYYMRDGSERTMGRRDRSAERLPSYLGQGGSAIGIASDMALLPEELVAAADRVIEVRPLAVRDILGIVRRIASGRGKIDIDEKLAAAASPADLAMAIRPRTTASSCIARLRHIVGQRQVTPIDDSVPLLQDLAGYGAAKDWGLSLIRDVEQFRTNPFSIDIATLMRSVLLVGPTGVGKTLYARSLAKSLGVPLVETGYGEWSTAGGGYLNDVMSSIKDSFNKARSAAKSSGGISVLFIDELDSIPSRSTLVGGRNDAWWTALVNLLLTLTEIGSPARKGIVLVGATNYERRIDPALRRAGRFDTTIAIRLPDAADLASIMRTHLGADLLDVDLAAIAAMAPPSSGADASRWIREARRVARDRAATLRLADIVAQVAPPDGRSPEELFSVAVHEAGHAVVAIRIGFAPVITVSLIDKTYSGLTVFDVPDRETSTRQKLDNRVIVLLAGRAADEHFLASDTGAGGDRSSDLAEATAIIAATHVSYGLRDSLIHLAEPQDTTTLLRLDGTLRRRVSDDLAVLYEKAKSLVGNTRRRSEQSPRRSSRTGS